MARGPSSKWAWLLAGASLCACAEPRLELRVAPRELPQHVASEIAALSLEVEGFDIEVATGAGALANLDALAAGEADLAIIPNNVGYRPGVRTIARLYTGALHIMHRRQDEPASLAELVAGAAVFAGPEGSVERWVLEIACVRAGLDPAQLRYVDEAAASEVLFVFAPYIPDLEARFDGWRFYSLDDPAKLGQGSRVEALTLLQPQVRPLLIPKFAYPGINDDEAVLTVGVDVLLVARESLDETEAHALAEALVSERRRLADISPAVFEGLGQELDASRLTFPLHEGARQYFERDQPGFAERYAELIGVCFSVFVASTSALVAFAQWRSRRRKDRIDDYYDAVLAVRERVGEMDPSQRAAAASELRRLEGRAFRALIAEELAADEAFRIFVTLVHDTVAELRAAER